MKALWMVFGPPLGLRGAPGEPFLESESQHTPVVAVFPTGVADLILASVAPSTMPSPGEVVSGPLRGAMGVVVVCGVGLGSVGAILERKLCVRDSKNFARWGLDGG